MDLLIFLLIIFIINFNNVCIYFASCNLKLYSWIHEDWELLCVSGEWVHYVMILIIHIFYLNLFCLILDVAQYFSNFFFCQLIVCCLLTTSFLPLCSILLALSCYHDFILFLSFFSNNMKEVMSSISILRMITFNVFIGG